ncbi:MAG: acyltransferase [Candidatus Marinimicrobia bacterium]|nr:acyltransferase [Candidatus Neomarinimicrobiota bacterium]MBL7109674.1 acyltransferase [Candidatus Neomarinimicrobiota bacterium]
MAFLSKKQLKQMEFKYLGSNVLISDKASVYNCKNISIGDNSRIDDFCIISSGDGEIEIGKYVHIACFSSLIGKETIVMEDFSGLSSRVSIYSSSDDYSGNYLTNPTVPEKYCNVVHKPVSLKKHVIIGTGSVILPGVTIGEGTAIGALSLVNKNCKPNMIYSGIPAKLVTKRNIEIYKLEEILLSENDD